MMLETSHHSLPSLSHSSSSPAADIAAFDYVEETYSQSHSHHVKREPDRNDFDNFLDYGGMESGMDNVGPESFFMM